MRTETQCRCTDMHRCSKHVEMMKAIRVAWYGNDENLCNKIWSLQDGYGEAGYMPSQGYDWSGVRDSTIGAVEAMYAAVAAYGKRLGKFCSDVHTDLIELRKIGARVPGKAILMSHDHALMREYFQSMSVTECAGMLISLSQMRKAS